MAYNAEINVSVKNLDQVTDLEAKLSSISRNVNALNRGARGGGGRRGGGGGGGSEAEPLKEELALLKLQNTALGQSNRAIRAKNKLKGKNLELEDAISKLEEIGRGKDTRDIELLRKEVEERKKIVIEAEKTLAATVKTSEARSKIKPISTELTAGDRVGLLGLSGKANRLAGKAEGVISADKQKEINAKLLPSTEMLRPAVRGIKQLDKSVRNLGKVSKITGKNVQFLASQYGPQEPGIFQPPQGPFSRLSDRQSRDVTGRRTRLNNPLGGIASRLGATRGFDAGSALISGGFPLLFGQGPAVAAAGALGGGIGGMFGQMGGFAGGIAATAAVQSIQNAVTAVSQLGQALSPITPNIQALSQSLGLVGTQEQKRLELIEEVKGKQAAFNAAVDEMRRVIGDEATEKLREFGESTRLIGSEFSIAMTKMQSALAGLFGAVDRFLGLTRGAEKSQRNRAIAGSDNPEIVRRREEIERLQNTTGGGRSGAKSRQDRIKTLKAELDELGKQEVVVNNIATRRKNLNLIESSAGKKLRQENELLQAKLDGNFEEVQLAQQLDAEIQKRLDKGMGIMEIDIESISNAIELNNKLEKQVELSEKIGSNFEIIGESIASGVSDNLTAAIQGTKTLGDAAKSILNDLSSSLIRLGVNTLLSKIPGFGGLPILGTRSKGGPVRTGGSFVVGEKGPELFVPKRSGTIIPNDKLAGGGSTNISVNVDASGSSVQSNEQQGKELGRVISAAIQSELIKQRRPGGLLR